MSKNVVLYEKNIDNLLNLLENSMDRIITSQDVWKKKVLIVAKDADVSVPYGQDRLLAMLQRYIQVLTADSNDYNYNLKLLSNIAVNTTVTRIQPDHQVQGQGYQISPKTKRNVRILRKPNHTQITSTEIQCRNYTELDSDSGISKRTISTSEEEEYWLPSKKLCMVTSKIMQNRTALNNINMIDGYVTIGSSGTKVSLLDYYGIKWDCTTKATRGLMDVLFTKSVMATSSLTGKLSPAFRDRKRKKQLDPVIVNDIIECILRKFENVANKKLVRQIITSKCADECKLWKKTFIKIKGSIPNDEL
ncbi:protein insensitive-like [Aethina tumida]|uniref:protein insensitive-like n=1 Tax=Aethina tumida TaxID=116153 RepID=UPI0021489F46|nr:protein insensitive-like [Aethina tumida]